MQTYIDNTKQQMEKVLEHLNQELTKVRTGRAQVSMLDGVLVEAYDQQTPINQVALLTTPDAQQILVKPFDPNLMENIEHGIVKANLGLNPINDGENIRIAVPGLTEETRKEIAKEVKVIGEQAKISIRNARRDNLDKAKKNDELTQDDAKGCEKQIQDLTDTYNKKIDDIIKNKEQEVLTI